MDLMCRMMGSMGRRFSYSVRVRDRVRPLSSARGKTWSIEEGTLLFPHSTVDRLR